VSLKENFEGIKEEVRNEGFLLEYLFRAEKWFLKYRNIFIGLAVLIVVAVAANFGWDYMEQRRLETANEALRAWQADPADKEAEARLKANNPLLYDLARLQTAAGEGNLDVLNQLAGSENRLVAGMAAYQAASLAKDPAKLKSYAMGEDAMLKDLALLQGAVLYFKSGKEEEAKALLRQISFESQLKNIAVVLEHYGVGE